MDTLTLDQTLELAMQEFSILCEEVHEVSESDTVQEILDRLGEVGDDMAQESDAFEIHELLVRFEDGLFELQDALRDENNYHLDVDATIDIMGIFAECQALFFMPAHPAVH